MSQHSCLHAQPALAPAPPAGGQFLRLGPWLFSAAWPSFRPPWPARPAAFFQPQPEQFFTPPHVPLIAPRRRPCSGRLSSSCACWCGEPAHFCASCAEPLLTGSQSLTWTSDTSPRASSAAAAFRSSSAFLAAAAFAAALSAALAARAFARFNGAFSSSSAASFSAALRAAVAACDKRDTPSVCYVGEAAFSACRVTQASICLAYLSTSACEKPALTCQGCQ